MTKMLMRDWPRAPSRAARHVALVERAAVAAARRVGPARFFFLFPDSFFLSHFLQFSFFFPFRFFITYTYIKFYTNVYKVCIHTYKNFVYVIYKVCILVYVYTWCVLWFFQFFNMYVYKVCTCCIQSLYMCIFFIHKKYIHIQTKKHSSNNSSITVVLVVVL